MRDNWLSDQIFRSYDDILDHSGFAWNRLVDQPCRITSIGGMGTWVMTSEIWYKDDLVMVWAG